MVLERNEIGIPNGLFHMMFDTQSWIGSMIGIALLKIMNEARLPSLEVLIKAVVYGLDIIRHFQTERVLPYLEIFDRLLKQFLKSDSIRIMLIPVFPICINMSWEYFENQCPCLFYSNSCVV
jgi:hypothetical protein